MKAQDSNDENLNPTRIRGGGAVVLVHGIWMTGLEMRWLGLRLASCGFTPSHFRYRSIHRSPAENARQLGYYLKRLNADQIHLVGHSLGGIVLLHLFEQFPDLPPGRVVLMGSPVLGSGVAEHMAGSRWLRPILGRSTERGLLGGVPAWTACRDLGVIAGTLGVGVGRILGGFAAPGDGTVAVAEARLPGAALRIMDTSHTSMLFSPAVAREVCHFLRHGCFSGTEPAV